MHTRYLTISSCWLSLSFLHSEKPKYSLLIACMLTSMTNSVHRGSKFEGHKHNSCETHSLYICMCASLTLQNSGSRRYTKDQRSLRIDQFYWVKVQSNVLKCRTQGTQDQIVKCMYGMEICQLKVNLKRTTVRGQVVWWSIQWSGRVPGAVWFCLKNLTWGWDDLHCCLVE